ncbi:hypothetical protein ABZV31_06470 [Streptomyces sp. NPDC005202]|uniref:hypothetical protein n=1 Tax=Streptomyces sp. NPDC005202 TaxID=3157021 RepID=UPI0033AD2EFF
MPLGRRALRKGVAVRKIVQAAALDDLEARDYVQELVQRGAHIGITDAPGDWVLILDRNVVVRPADGTRRAAGRRASCGARARSHG